MNTGTARHVELLAWLAGCLAIGTNSMLARQLGSGRVLFALVMTALGIRGLIFGDFAGSLQGIPIEPLPAHDFFVYLTALVELATGIGILIPRIAKTASAVMAIFTLLWLLLLKFPEVVTEPGVALSWLDVGEVAVIFSGAWIVFASLANPEGRFISGHIGMRNARLLFLLALPAIGLSHFVYSDSAAGFVPAWLPWPYVWAYLTGAADIIAAAGILFGVWPRLAATLEAGMLWLITLLVWVPAVFAQPRESVIWATLLISAVIAASASVVAATYRGVGWRTLGLQPA